MAKYDPIGKFLLRKEHRDVVLSFAEIERIICAVLPQAAGDTAWWTSENTPQSKAWKSAGYEVEVDPNNETVTFQRYSANKSVERTKAANPV